MPDNRKRAFAAASLYAPAPNGSIIVYGLTGSVLFGLAVMLFGWVYSVDLALYVALIAAGLIVAFGIGVLTRRRRKHRHVEALAIERTRLGSGPDITPAA